MPTRNYKKKEGGRRRSQRKRSVRSGSSGRTKRSRYTSKRHHKRSAPVMGRIFPPIDVRSVKDFPEMMKRLVEGPVSIVLIYADWCGHCDTFKPHFDAASKSPERSVQSIKINESVLNDANSYLSKNLSNSSSFVAEGYPHMEARSANNVPLSKMEVVRDTDTMTRVMNETGKMPSSFVVNNSGFVSKSASANANMNAKKNNMNSMNAIKNSMNEGDVLSFNDNVESLASSRPVMGESVKLSNKNNMSSIEDQPIIAEPPMPEDLTYSVAQGASKDLTSSVAQSAPVITIGTDMNTTEQKGGALFSTMGQVAYKLAPAGLLLGLATQVVKPRRKHVKKTVVRKKKATVRKGRKAKTSKKSRRR
jgi:thiol-disulfide isomerase/thioredoxin